MSDVTGDRQAAAERGEVTRALEVTLDPSPSQERWLRSYVGSMRVAYDWTLEQVADNLHVRRDERARGVPEDELTPALSWSRESLTAAWREVRDEVHPWHRDVSIHAFRTGEPRLGETEPVPQAPGGHGSSEAAPDPAGTPEVAA